MTGSVDELQVAAEGRWVAGFLAGPTWTRYDSLPAQQGDMAPDLELPDTSGSRDACPSSGPTARRSSSSCATSAARA